MFIEWRENVHLYINEIFIFFLWEMVLQLEKIIR